MNRSIDRHKELMMKQIDGEISPGEAQELAEILSENPELQSEYNMLKTAKEKAQTMKSYHLPELVWEDYWGKLYNRMERGIAWILVSIGAILVLGYALWEFLSQLMADSTMPVALRFGIFALFFGALILIFSVFREKILLRKHDKYKEIQR